MLPDRTINLALTYQIFQRHFSLTEGSEPCQKIENLYVESNFTENKQIRQSDCLIDVPATHGGSACCQFRGCRT